MRSYKRRIVNEFVFIRDPALVPRLHLLLKHEDDFLRANVAASLRNIQSSSSIPYFVDGLEDRNRKVRYHCMMGLAKFFKKYVRCAPSYDKFLENESKYISLWKDWWEKEGKFLQR